MFVFIFYMCVILFIENIFCVSYELIGHNSQPCYKYAYTFSLFTLLQTVSGLYSLAEKACPVELRDKYTSNSKKETKGEEEYAYNPNRKVKIKF